MIEIQSIYKLLKLPKSKLSTTVECLICGGSYKSLGNHLIVHQTNVEEYKLEFDAATCSEELRVHLSLSKNSRKKNFKYLQFHSARKIARELGLKNHKEWKLYIQTNKLPKTISKSPQTIYKNHGWVSWSDWLNTKNISPHIAKEYFLDFKAAKKYVHSLKIKNVISWHHWTQLNSPKDIPSAPHLFYKECGWVSWSDWLGTKNIGNSIRSKNFLNFKTAKKFVHTLNLKSQTDWFHWHKKHSPSDIPVSPSSTYKNKGWISWNDWFGHSRLSTQNRHKNFISFKAAREYAHNLNLSGASEWYKWAKLNKLVTIPCNPDRTYRNKGWVSWLDWLGNSKQTYKPFRSARKVTKGLGLKNWKEWWKYSKSDRPSDIPANPQVFYKDKGWISLKDWLGCDIL